MALVNNGYKRAESITVTKYINGIPQTPIKYWVILGFSSFPSLGYESYPAISSYTYQTMSNDDFIKRRNAFILHITSIEQGIILSKDQFEIYDTTFCPLIN